MAQLNVRERRLEATIAYVGPELAGKATNLERLGSPRSSGDDVLARDWTPRSSPAELGDFEVTVRLVAPRGVPSEARVRELLREADGVVFVADADPAAHDRNRASLATVREILASDPTRTLPVVVQINKADLPDALPADEVVRALDAEAWPHVSASASRGDGVVETAERSLSTVVDALRSRGGDSAGPNAPVAPVPSRDGNPLLSALRQVLRDTVAEHVTEIEARTNANTERMLAAFFERIAGSLQQRASADLATFQAVVDENAQLRAAVGALDARIEDVHRELRDARASFAAKADSTAGAVDQLGAAFAAIEETVRTASSTVDRLREEIRDDVVRALEARARREREHFLGATTVIKRAIDAVAADVKSLDTSASLASMLTTLGGISEQTAALSKTLEPTAAAVRAIEPRVGKAETSLLREIREGLGKVAARIEDRVDVLRVETSEAIAGSGTTATETHALVSEMVEELKKKKKGWFS